MVNRNSLQSIVSAEIQLLRPKITNPTSKKWKNQNAIKIGAFLFLIAAAVAVAITTFSYPMPSEVSLRRLQGANNLLEIIGEDINDEALPRWASKQQKDDLLIIDPFKVDTFESNTAALQKIVPYSPNNQFTTEQMSDMLIAGDISHRQRTMAQRFMNLKAMDLFVTNAVADEQRSYYEKKYNISQYDQLPICVVVPSFNNEAGNRAISNMASIAQQEYSNFHIVFIDDASTDNTSEIVKEFFESQKFPKAKYTMIKNTIQLKAMANLRRAAKQFCAIDSIFMVVDGDDELIGRQVFKFYNAVFQQRQIWFMYSNFLNPISKNIGYSRAIPLPTRNANAYRTYPFTVSHLRAFYTKLFLKIRQQDLQTKDGKYYEAANDVAICMPILEMAHLKVAYVPQLTYAYNDQTGLNNHKIRIQTQRRNDQLVRINRRYPPLQTLDDSIEGK